MNNYSCTGRIISTDYITGDEPSKNRLSVSVSVPTGQRRNPDEQYAPSNIVRGTLWGKLADAVNDRLVEGTTYIGVMTGTLAKLRPYNSESGEVKCSLEFHRVAEFKTYPLGEYPSDDAEEDTEASKASAKKTTKKKTAPETELPF